VEAGPARAPWLRQLLGVRPLRRAGMALVHVALWALAFGLAVLLRFEGPPPPRLVALGGIGLGLLLALRLLTFHAVGLLDGLWRYAGLSELRKLVAATTVSSLLLLAIQTASHLLVPRSVLLGEWLASVVLVGGARMLIRSLWERRSHHSDPIPTLIVGAGNAGESFLRELLRAQDGSSWRVVGLLDDDPKKQDSQVHGVRVLGPADGATLSRAVKRLGIGLVVLAWPSASGERTRELLRACRGLRVRTKTVASLSERISGATSLQLREPDIADLLRRDPVRLDLDQVGGLLSGKAVLITGAGGSIGSELARQALGFSPSSLLLLDHDENALFFIERELRATFPDAVLVPLMADVTDPSRLDWIFDRYRPAVVLHAAAHKHVGMMERNPGEAVKNNVFGTQLLARAADSRGAEAFVLVSTDKAVKPSSVMGATKRACEMIVQGFAGTSSTRFSAVRFGNVLGSAGSVVPLFREQIARGGPVTVTDPEASRYFMTIPEAAQLVLQAAALSRSGEIFLLDMGRPVRIVDMARDLIELSGLRPDEDIEIHFTGLAQGEKLHEELLVTAEGVDHTVHPKIMLSRIQPRETDLLARDLHRLAGAVLRGDEAVTRAMLGDLVPEARLGMGAGRGDQPAARASGEIQGRARPAVVVGHRDERDGGATSDGSAPNRRTRDGVSPRSRRESHGQ
jgi:FlaA1/EpsC-like NDP-sugar epimerase